MRLQHQKKGNTTSNEIFLAHHKILAYPCWSNYSIRYQIVRNLSFKCLQITFCEMVSVGFYLTNTIMEKIITFPTLSPLWKLYEFPYQFDSHMHLSFFSNWANFCHERILFDLGNATNFEYLCGTDEMGTKY